MSDLILFWHRRDLRISDHTGLAAAREKSAKIVGVFCLDPQILEGDDIAPVRVKYMMGCLQSLQERYQQAGSQLLILQNDPVIAIPKLAAALTAKAVFWNWDVEPYSQIRDLAVSEALKVEGIEFLNYNWDQLLHSPTEIFSGTKTPYTVYTPFWKNWITKSKAKPVKTLANLENLTAKEEEIAQQEGTVNLPAA
jgi:deoxyribodipyrimidine photo-lyase